VLSPGLEAAVVQHVEPGGAEFVDTAWNRTGRGSPPRSGPRSDTVPACLLAVPVLA
jgi:hypothetical protein